MSRLPDFLFDTYKRYKEGNQRVLVWLTETAHQCGFKMETPTPAPSRRLKGKARIEARKAGTISNEQSIHLSTKCFGEMVNYIADYKPSITVPNFILHSLRVTISLRKRCADWFQAKKKVKQNPVNDGHLHFIHVLENALAVLDPLSSSDPKPATAVPLTNPDIAKSHLSGTTNRFNILSIEEDFSLDEATEPQGTTSSNQNFVTETKPGSTYEFPPTDEEVYFALFCFFNDLADLREYLSMIWTEYREGNIDLVSASITTNTAFELVQRSEKDLISTFPKLSDYEKSAVFFYALMCILRDEKPEYREQPGDVVNFNMLDIAEFVYMPIYSTLCSFCNVIQPDHLPSYKPGYFGTYDPLKDRNSLSTRQQMHEDRLILLENLPEFCVLAFTRDDLKLFDQLTIGFRDMCRTKSISIWLTFSAQIYIDIHHILRTDVTRGLKDLQYAGLQASKTLDVYLANSQIFTNWPANNEAIVKNLRKFIDDCIANDSIGITKQKMYGRQGPLPPMGPPFALLPFHPLGCGLLQFYLHMRLQESGIILALAWGSIMYVAHLYHACRVGGYMDDIWPDMELILKIHTPEQVFAGRAPQTPEESLKAMSIMLGGSALNFAQSRRRGGLVLSKKGPKGLRENSPITEVLKARYLGHGDLKLTLDTVEKLVEDEKISLSDQGGIICVEKGAPESILQRQWAKNHKLSTLQLVEALLSAISAEKYALRLDYFSLHLRCLDLLRALRAELDSKFRQYFGDDYLENDTQLVFIVHYIFMVARGAQVLGEELGAPTASRMMVRAAGIMESFLCDKSVVECDKLLTLVHGERSQE